MELGEGADKGSEQALPPPPTPPEEEDGESEEIGGSDGGCSSAAEEGWWRWWGIKGAPAPQGNSQVASLELDSSLGSM